MYFPHAGVHNFCFRADLFRFRADHLKGLIGVAQKDRRRIFSEDPRLLACDRRDRVAKIGHVIQTDPCDHGDLLIGNRIGGVKPSAEAGLQDQIIRALFVKPQHCHEEQEFKIQRVGKSVPLRLRALCSHQVKIFQKFFFGDHFAIERHPFPDIRKMGGSEETDAEAGFPKAGGDKGRDASLAVGSRDMHDLHTLMGIAEPFQISLNVRQRAFPRKTRRVVQICGCFL